VRPMYKYVHDGEANV